MRIDIITLFPDEMQQMIRFSVVGRAVENGLLMVNAVNPRTFADNRHATVDDRPYGGGPGMVMMVEPLKGALNEILSTVSSRPVVTYLSPQGRVLDHQMVTVMAKRSHLVLICGRYEGIDERFINAYVDEELSLGDFVLSGGELAAAVVVDAVARLLPGVLGQSESAEQDSFVDGLLDCPHYTRPEHLPEGKVPPVLLSGDHAAIRRWRHQQSLGMTWLKRPDLLDDENMDAEDRTLLEHFIRDHHTDDPTTETG